MTQPGKKSAPRAPASIDDDPWVNNPWEWEIRYRRPEGKDEHEFRHEVIVKYLNAGNPKLLIGSILLQKPLWPRTFRFVAAMFMEQPFLNEPVHVFVGMVPSAESNGGPHDFGPPDEVWLMRFESCKRGELRELPEPPNAWCWRTLMVWCLGELSKHRNFPDSIGRRFMEGVAKAFRLGMGLKGFEDWREPDFPIKFRLEFRDLSHRPKDPELSARDEVVCWQVEQALARGLTLTGEKGAIQEVRERNNLSFETVRAIYYAGRQKKSELPA